MYVCKYCQEEFKLKKSLDNHARTVHSDKVDDPTPAKLPKFEVFAWRCPTCVDLKFAKKSDLEKHITTVHPDSIDWTFSRAMGMMTAGLEQTVPTPQTETVRADGVGNSSDDETPPLPTPPVAKFRPRVEKGLVYCHSKDFPQYRIHYYHKS